MESTRFSVSLTFKVSADVNESVVTVKESPGDWANRDWLICRKKIRITLKRYFIMWDGQDFNGCTNFCLSVNRIGYMIKYQMIKQAEEDNIKMLSQMGMVAYRVTNPSRKAAMINTGTSPIIIFIPSFAPRLREGILLKVPGNRRLLPKTRPAAPAIIMEDISSVPCIQITSTDFHPRPFEKK